MNCPCAKWTGRRRRRSPDVGAPPTLGYSWVGFTRTDPVSKEEPLGEPLKIVAVVVAKDGRQAELEALLRGMVSASRAEPGNLSYDLWRDVDQPNRFVLDEMYRDADAVAAHRASEHFQAYLKRVTDLAERTPMVLRAEDVD